MIKLKWYDTIFIAEKAVKTEDTIIFYDAEGHEINRIVNISPREWSYIELDGDWTDPEDIPTDKERLQADLDYLTMENEYLVEQNEQARADIDYCLMLLEEA